MPSFAYDVNGQPIVTNPNTPAVADVHPGDPGFDWSKYGSYLVNNQDPVAGAKQALQDTAETSSLLDRLTPAKATGAPQQTQDTSFGQTYAPGLSDTPSDAFYNEIARTGGKAALGLAKSPITALQGLAGMVAHPVSSVGALASAVAHPLDTAGALAKDPEAVGGLVGQFLLGKAAPSITGAARGPAGSAVSGVGRALEAAGSSPYAKGAALANMVVRPSVTSAMEAAAPWALEYGGKGMQKLGTAIQGLGRAGSEMEQFAPNVSGYRPPPQSTEVRGSSWPPQPSGQTYSSYMPPTAEESAFNRTYRNAPYGEGAIIPGATPSEYTEPTQYQAATPTGPAPAIRVPEAAPWEQMPAGYEVTGSEAPAGPPSAGVATGSNPLSNPQWGSKASAQAESSPMHPIYDPQTATRNLQALRALAKDSAEVAYLDRALRQRSHVQNYYNRNPR